MIKNYIDPKMISIRTKKIDIIDEAMNSNPLIRIQYSAKKAGYSNSWKKWIGEIQGLERMNTIGKKQEFEARLTKWIEANDETKAKYGNILPAYKEVYSGLREYMLVNSFTNEVMNGIEAMTLARSLRRLSDLFEKNADDEAAIKLKSDLIEYSKEFFKDYNRETDMKLFAALMQSYGETLEEKWLTPEYLKLKRSCQNNFAGIAGKIYKSTIFADQSKFTAFVTDFGTPSVNKLKKDPLYVLSVDAGNFLSKNVVPELIRLNSEVQKLNRIYMQAQMEFDTAKVYYPDANSTLRVSYGTVRGYFPRDAVYFEPVSTLEGIIEKDNPEIYDYDVPERLKELFLNRDYGRYAKDGKLPVCFIANNHTTGGNSGSPVINAEGFLIGINFDRAWEGVASDMAFNPDKSRNISLDIRYALFIIDKFAGAGYLLNEMKIIE
jgi:hypothetical protein